MDSISFPADRNSQDKAIAFEGPGWESDKVAYRLYLDARNVPDIYGKKLPGRILDRIGQGRDDYSGPADWGMDIFQVGQTLGMGGIGVMRGGKVTQLGPAAITARIWNSPRTGDATVAVASRGFPGENGPADLFADYSIAPGSRVTRVAAVVTGAIPQMVAGLTLHPGVERMESRTGPMRYIATWGVQSLAHDELGIALFYPAHNVVETRENAGTWFVRFCDSGQLRYAFAAAWVQEPGAPRTAAAFRQWLDATALALEGSMAPPEERVAGAAEGCTH